MEKHRCMQTADYCIVCLERWPCKYRLKEMADEVEEL